MGIKRSTGRFVAPIIIFALLLGTAWTGRASVARVDVDPALHAGEVALIQVAAGTAWTVAAHLTAAGATEVAAFDSVNVVSARLSDKALAAVATDRSVLRATTNARVTAVGGGRSDGKDLNSFGTSSKKDSVGIDAIDAPSAWSRSTGAGVVVALMDSGISAHPDLPAGKVLARANFAGDNSLGLDPAGHGTHLAGIIAGNGSDFRGVAPDARLVDIRVLDRNGDGTLYGVVAGFNWLLKNRNALTIRVLNLSLGTTQRSSYHDDLLAALAEAAWFSGVAVVAAAGNEGPVPGMIATPGADPFIITAGSFDDQGTPAAQDDRESAFSSRGATVDGFAKPDVLAPGRRVVSLRANGSRLELTGLESVVTNAAGVAARVDLNSTVNADGHLNGNGQGNGNGNKNNANLYIRMSGTSVSSAMVSGVAALIVSVHADYTPTKTKGALVASGRSLTGSVSRAVTATTALSATPGAVNRQLLPSRLLMTTLENSGVVEGGTNWEGVTWEGVTWEAVTWEGVSWESVTWESVSWEGVMWETVSWEQDPLLDGER